jgi:hypothetical protein
MEIRTILIRDYCIMVEGNYIIIFYSILLQYIVTPTQLYTVYVLHGISAAPLYFPVAFLFHCPEMEFLNGIFCRGFWA